MKRPSIAFLLCAALLPAVADTCVVLVDDHADQEAIKQHVAPLLPPDVEYSAETLPTEAINIQDAEKMAKAIRYGITELPTLQLSDEEGIYATLPLRLATAEALEQARSAEAKETHRNAAAQREFQAEQFLLFTCMKIENPMSDISLEHCIADCRALMQHEQATDADKQRLGFLCLYPMLMQQYTNGYKGCHTPATEAKLLEAIAALEAARDIDPESKLGHKAYLERERLRKARREARKYE